MAYTAPRPIARPMNATQAGDETASRPKKAENLEKSPNGFEASRRLATNSTHVTSPEIPPGVIFWTHRDDFGPDNEATQQRWLEWMAVTFPPEVCQNLVLLPVYRANGRKSPLVELGANLAVELPHGPTASQGFGFVECACLGLFYRKQPDVMGPGEGESG